MHMYVCMYVCMYVINSDKYGTLIIRILTKSSHKINGNVNANFIGKSIFPI